MSDQELTITEVNRIVGKLTAIVNKLEGSDDKKGLLNAILELLEKLDSIRDIKTSLIEEPQKVIHSSLSKTNEELKVLSDKIENTIFALDDRTDKINENTSKLKNLSFGLVFIILILSLALGGAVGYILGSK